MSCYFGSTIYVLTYLLTYLLIKRCYDEHTACLVETFISTFWC